MKISLQQLERHLAGQLAPLYLITGDALLLINETAERVRITAKKTGFSEYIRIVSDSNQEWCKQLHTETHSRSLLSEKRIIEMDLRQIKLNQTSTKFLEEYAENPPADTILILLNGKMDARATQTAWYRTIEKKGAVITIWPVAAEELPKWILQRARQLNLALSEKSATLIARQSEGNLFAAAQELEKLALWAISGETPDEKTLEEIIASQSRFDIFQLADATLLGNAKRARHILERLLLLNIEPVLILWALARDIRMVSEFLYGKQQGKSFAELCELHRVWEKRKPLVRACLERHTLSSCQKLLLTAARIDRMVKGVEPGNLPESLERLVLAFANSVGGGYALRA